MSKKQMEALDAPSTLNAGAVASVATPEVDQGWKRETALQLAISHHKTNGGMLTAQQLIDNAKYFHAYLTGETK
jgi:hypothetical protein